MMRDSDEDEVVDDNTNGERQSRDGNRSNLILTSYTNRNGYQISKGFPVGGFESGLKYVAQPRDLFVATYPKCGTTWMQHIVYLILHRGKPLQPHQRLDQEFSHLEEIGAEYCERLGLTPDWPDGAKGYRLIKTHLYYSMTPYNPRAKYIHVVRNPKDCVVSFFHHTRGFENLYRFANGSFDVYFDLFAKGEVDFGDYFIHLRSWLDHRMDENVLFITYEEMRAKPKEAILQVARFLDPEGLQYEKELQAKDGAILNEVLEHSSLQKMKGDPQRWSSERGEQHTPFVRKGNVGGWMELLKTHQICILDQKMRNMCTDEELKVLGECFTA